MGKIHTRCDAINTRFWRKSICMALSYSFGLVWTLVFYLDIHEFIKNLLRYLGKLSATEASAYYN